MRGMAKGEQGKLKQANGKAATQQSGLKKTMEMDADSMNRAVQGRMKEEGAVGH